MLGNPRDAFDSLKALQLQKRTLTLTPEHIADLNTRFDEAFSNLKTRQNDQWKSEMGTRVKNLERAIEKDAEFITRLEEQIEDLKNKMVEAHSEIYRTKIGGWITEKENKIREVETHKAELEAKTRDIKEKSGTPTVDSPPATDPT